MKIPLRGSALCKTRAASHACGQVSERLVVQQRQWRAAALCGTSRHAANCDRHFSTGGADLLTARFRVRVPVRSHSLIQEPHSAWRVDRLTATRQAEGLLIATAGGVAALKY